MQAQNQAGASSQSAASNSRLTPSQSHTLVITSVITSHHALERRTAWHRSSDAAHPRWRLHHA
jgi:hypothetical protein